MSPPHPDSGNASIEPKLEVKGKPVTEIVGLSLSPQGSRPHSDLPQPFSGYTSGTPKAVVVESPVKGIVKVFC